MKKLRLLVAGIRSRIFSLFRIRDTRLVVVFIRDYVRSIFNEKYTAAPSSYLLMRRLYSWSLGRSSQFLSIPYILLYPPSNKPTATAKNIARHIRQKGFYIGSSTENLSELAYSLHAALSCCPVYEVVEDDQSSRLFKTPVDGISSSLRVAARLAHYRHDVVGLNETWDLIRSLGTHDIASTYLMCDPVLTSIESWYVVPIHSNMNSCRMYSAAAQTFHYDMDWIKFIKIFVNLTDVDNLSGPFEFVSGSHAIKDPRYFADGRFDNLYERGGKIERFTGCGGSFCVADTSGIHRDGRAASSWRHVLQIEYAVSSFGAKFQYDSTIIACQKYFKERASAEKKKGRLFSMVVN